MQIGDETSMKSGDVSGEARNTLEVMCVSTDTTVIARNAPWGYYLSVGAAATGYFLYEGGNIIAILGACDV